MNSLKPVAYDYSEIPKEKLSTLLDLISSGGEVNRLYVEENLPLAERIVILSNGDEIISTATIKNPKNSYRKRIFKEAGVADLYEKYALELGYIVTDPNHEGKGHGRAVMIAAIETLQGRSAFASTRKPKMIKMLEKNGFKQVGEKYKDDLHLFVYN